MVRVMCDSISYRKGYIDVSPEIHEGCVNLEVTNIHPEVDIFNVDIGEDEIADETFTGNTEIELSVENAEELVRVLQEAISKVKEVNLES